MSLDQKKTVFGFGTLIVHWTASPLVSLLVPDHVLLYIQCWEQVSSPVMANHHHES